MLLVARLGVRAAVAAAALAVLSGQPLAQDTAAEEAAHRRQVLARLPADAAQRLFGLEATPSAGPALSIGTYTKGCIAGAVAMPADGPEWQVMRPARNRAWGHPMLIEFLKRLAGTAPAAGWPGLLIGDLAQPRGGPMLTGHASHQIGIEADVWLTPMPDRRLSREERDAMLATNLVAPNGLDIDPHAWRPEHRKLLETAARSPGVERIFVNAAIKKALCREAGGDRAWLRLIRPWWGHNYHFHVRLACPPADSQCHDPVPPPPPGDGCDQLGWWFTEEALHPKPGPPRPPVRIGALPAACAALVPAP